MLANGYDREGRVNVQERNPKDVLEERHEDILLSKAVLKERVPDVAGAKEHDRRREPDLKRVHVEAIDRELEAEEDVVDDTDGDRSSDAV